MNFAVVVIVRLLGTVTDVVYIPDCETEGDVVTILVRQLQNTNGSSNSKQQRFIAISLKFIFIT